MNLLESCRIVESVCKSSTQWKIGINRTLEKISECAKSQKPFCLFAARIVTPLSIHAQKFVSVISFQIPDPSMFENIISAL